MLCWRDKPIVNLGIGSVEIPTHTDTFTKLSTIPILRTFAHRASCICEPEHPPHVLRHLKTPFKLTIIHCLKWSEQYIQEVQKSQPGSQTVLWLRNFPIPEEYPWSHWSLAVQAQHQENYWTDSWQEIHRILRQKPVSIEVHTDVVQSMWTLQSAVQGPESLNISAAADLV